MKNTVIIVLIFLLALSIALNFFSRKEIASLAEENAVLKTDKISLLSEHEECLIFKEQTLKKELLSKYLDWIMALANKVENGYEPTTSDLSDFKDRTGFILENVSRIGISKEETNLILAFIDAAKNTISEKNNTKFNDNAE